MTSILGLVLLVVLAIIGKYIFEKIHLKTNTQNFLIYSGTFYLLIGLFLNPDVLRFPELSVFRKNEFFFDFILGWTGFLVGLQLSIKGIKRFPTKYFLYSSLSFAFTFFVIAAIFFAFNTLLNIKLSNLEILLMSIVGSMSSILSVGLLSRQRKIPSYYAHYLQFASALDNILGVVVFGLLFFAYQTIHIGRGPALLNLGISLLLVFLLAQFYKYFNKEFKTFEEESLLLLGLILIIVGMARLLQNSIIFTSFLFGFMIVNMADTKKILLTVQEWEKPLNYILFLFIGLYLNIYIVNYAYVLLIFLFAIFGVKYFVSKLQIRFLHPTRSRPNQRNQILWGITNISMAMVLDAYFTNYHTQELKLLSIVVIVYYITNVATFYSFKKVG